LVDSTPRSASVTAVESTELLRLEQRVFYSLIEKRPDISQGMLKALVIRLRDYNKLEAELTQKNIEIEMQAKELEKQRAELEALNSTKDKFFAIIAHDLKNPFSTVLGLSELLAREFETFDSDSLKNFIKQIYKYSNNTFNLLENLLQWSMVQTGRMPLRPKFVSLRDIVHDSVELLAGNAENKGIEIEVSLCDECTAFVDTNQITAVIRNLLTNAIKFTSSDGKVSVSVKPQDEFWLVTIADSGIGISEHDQKKLFMIDSNPTTIGTSQEKGTGLGLILCHEFVERNGGKIWVESTLGKGSSFIFTVPKSDKITEPI
jgi:signal transduction histidine kinase